MGTPPEVPDDILGNFKDWKLGNRWAKIVLGFLYYSSDLSKSLYLFVDVCWCIGSRIHLWIHFLFRIFDIIYLWFMYHPFIYLFVGHHRYLFTVHTRTDTHRHAHRLAQNCHCEFRCRVHLTCKNNPFKPDRRRSLRGPEKSCHRHSQCKLEEIGSWSLSTKPYRSQLDRLRKPYKKCKK